MAQMIATPVATHGFLLDGKWVEEGNPNSYIELHPDKTFILGDIGGGVGGKYSINHGEISLMVNNGVALKATVEGNTLTIVDIMTKQPVKYVKR